MVQLSVTSRPRQVLLLSPQPPPAEFHSAPQSPDTVAADKKDDEEREGLEFDTNKPKPKKKTKKSSGKNRKAAPTGFEGCFQS